MAYPTKATARSAGGGAGLLSPTGLSFPNPDSESVAADAAGPAAHYRPRRYRAQRAVGEHPAGAGGGVKPWHSATGEGDRRGGGGASRLLHFCFLSRGGTGFGAAAGCRLRQPPRALSERPANAIVPRHRAGHAGQWAPALDPFSVGLSPISAADLVMS